MTNGVVVFNLAEFAAAYPDAAEGLTAEQLQNYFDLATDILNNTARSPVCNLDRRKRMLYLITAHLALLYKRGAGTVGATSGATEGSVSVNFQIPLKPNAEFFMPTIYGQLFWQLSLPYRMGRYVD